MCYHGMDGKRNGVGFVLREDLAKSVLEVNRMSDRAVGMRLELGGLILHVPCTYAPLVGCEMEEKETFWREMDELPENSIGGRF